MKPHSQWRGTSLHACPVLSTLATEWELLPSLKDADELAPALQPFWGRTDRKLSLSLAPHHSKETNRKGEIMAQPLLSASKQRSPPHLLFPISKLNREDGKPARKALSPLLFNL